MTIQIPDLTVTLIVDNLSPEQQRALEEGLRKVVSAAMVCTFEQTLEAHAERQTTIEQTLNHIKQQLDRIERNQVRMADTIADIDAVETEIEAQDATDAADAQKTLADLEAKITLLQAGQQVDTTPEVNRLKAILANTQQVDAAIVAADPGAQTATT